MKPGARTDWGLGIADVMVAGLESESRAVDIRGMCCLSLIPSPVCSQGQLGMNNHGEPQGTGWY